MMRSSDRQDRWAGVVAASVTLWLAAACAGAPGARQETLSVQSQHLFAQSLAAQDAHDEARATDLLRQLIALNPNLASAHTNLGVLLAHAGRSDEAVAEYERAIALAPSDAAAYYNLGLAHRRRGAFAEAERAYRRALERNPSQADAHYNLGILYELYLNRPNDALIQYRAARDLGIPDAETVSGWIHGLERRATATTGEEGGR